nr:hypothetical protein [Erwinia amylovora]
MANIANALPATNRPLPLPQMLNISGPPAKPSDSMAMYNAIFFARICSLLCWLSQLCDTTRITSAAMPGSRRSHHQAPTGRHRNSKRTIATAVSASCSKRCAAKRRHRHGNKGAISSTPAACSAAFMPICSVL